MRKQVSHSLTISGLCSKDETKKLRKVAAKSVNIELHLEKLL